VESLDAVCKEEFGIRSWGEFSWLSAVRTVEESAVQIYDEEEVLGLLESYEWFRGRG